MTAIPESFTEPEEWPDPIRRERAARALSWHSDGEHRDDYQHFRGYWLGAADMALKESRVVEVTAERDRLRTALELLAEGALSAEGAARFALQALEAPRG